MKVLPGVSCRLTERLSVGGTFGVGICPAELEGPYFLQGPGPLTGIPTLLDTQATGATPVWSAGLQYELSDCTMLGLSYLSESSFELDGNTRVDVPGLGSARYDSQLDVTWPQSVGVGLRHELCCHRIISADVLWYDWSSAFDEFVLRLRDPSNAAFPETDDHYPLNWRDSVSVRLGYEHELACERTLRFGYVYHRNPVPADTLTPFIQAILEHSVSVGYGWTWNCCELDLSYMYLFGDDESVGASQFVGGDFNNSRHEAAVHAINFGVIRRF
jgi:long-subunit fatty acid transport protein